MKQKTYLLIICIMITKFLYSQSLKTLLWQSVKPCYSELTNELEKNEEIADGEIIDDSKNGYLKVSGTYPTCGCSCTSTAGAYKQSNGSYITLATEEWGCSWKKKLSSNQSLEQILPKEFGIKSFIPEYDEKKYNHKYAVFYLDIDIPRVGTNTKASLKLIPYGVNYETKHIVTYTYEENNATTHIGNEVYEITNAIKDEQTLLYILKKQYDKITAHDKDIIIKNSNQTKDFIPSVTYLQEHIAQLHSIYTLYQSIQYNTIVLNWDRNKGAFYIKEKISRSETISFKDFILTKMDWWQAYC